MRMRAVRSKLFAIALRCREELHAATLTRIFSGAMALAINRQIAMSGPMMTCGELVKNGYTSKGTRAA